MKKYLLPSIKLSIILLVLCSALYPLLIAGVARFSPGGGGGETIFVKGRKVGYANVGQNFSQDKYFWGRPSAVNYNAAGSAGSNKGPSNPEYLKTVQNRLDSFLVHNPGINKHEVPTEMVTASGSGLDPDISPAAAFIQVQRIAATRKLDETKVKSLVTKHIEQSVFGPSKINVLKLNIALDEL